MGGAAPDAPSSLETNVIVAEILDAARRSAASGKTIQMASGRKLALNLLPFPAPCRRERPARAGTAMSRSFVSVFRFPPLGRKISRFLHERDARAYIELSAVRIA